MFYFNNMVEQIFRKSKQSLSAKYGYISVPFLPVYNSKKNNVFKNYTITPDVKYIK